MPRMPKRIKFRKQMRGKLRGNATRGNYVAFGDYGLQALEAHWVSARQIEAGPDRRPALPSPSGQGVHPRLPRQAHVARSRWRPAWARARRTPTTGPRA